MSVPIRSIKNLVQNGDQAWDRNHAIRQIIAAFPNNNAAPSPGAVRDALYRLGGLSSEPRYNSEAEAAVWLLGRVKAYCASALVRTTPINFRKSMQRWLNECMYDNDDSAWDGEYSRQEEKPGKKMLG